MKKTLLIISFYLLAAQLIAQIPASSNLPLIVINTNGQTIPNDPKITADMGIIYNGPGATNNATDPFNHYNGKIGIEIRGQSSQQFPMKSYSIELRDNAGSSINRSLFGLPSESDWVLYAPYNEKTLMHNFLAYTLSRQMGRWAANCRYAEVVINGEYSGIYILMEKIKRGSGRVNIPKINATDITGDAVTGGYIFSIDKEADAWYSAIRPNESTNSQTIRFSYIYPKIETIVNEQKNYIKSYVDSFETALKSQQYQNKQTGWRKFADENSFIDYFIVNELSRNVDGYRLSSYFHKNKNSNGGKIMAGPVWDYDLAFRNANYCNGSDTAGWAYRFNPVCPGDFWQVPFWWDSFSSDTAFNSNLRCRWKQLRQTTLSVTNLFSLIDSVTTLTSQARQRHFAKWPVLGQYVWPNPQPIATTYDGEIQTLKTWLTNRLKWMDANIPNTGACFDYPANVNESIIIKSFPNPVHEKLTLHVDSRNNQLLQIIIFDIAGRQQAATVYNLATGKNNFEIQTTGWAAGMYLLSYQSGNGETGTIKLIKQ
jgi:CotH kinase protein/Secretion system C-terminal sorting domain